MVKSKTLLVVLGPTAVGKTAVAISLAKHFRTAVVSADSRQFYKELPIGSAQPSPLELQEVKHYFIATNAVTDPVDAGTYSRQARVLLDELFQTHDHVILAGGSGLYIDAVLNGFDELPEKNPELRKELQEKFETGGIGYLQQRLQKLDPVYFEQVDKNNPARLIRAIEVSEAAGKPYSELRSGKKDELPFRVIKIGVELPREELYARINRRVDEMMKAGLEEEAKKLLPHKNLPTLQTVGYSELFDYFEGKTTLEKAVELIKQHTRNFAKRQLTWWRRDSTIHWFAPGNVAAMIAGVEGE